MKHDEIEYKCLLWSALEVWPVNMQLNIINYGDEKYAVDGLMEMADDNSEKCIGSEGEVIMRNLHDAIASAIHEVAKHLTRVVLADLRPEFIALKFKERLEDAIHIKDLGWSDADKELAQAVISKLPSGRAV